MKNKFEMLQIRLSIAGLAVRTAVRGAMVVVAEGTGGMEVGGGEVEVEVDGGLVGDVPAKTVKRGVTFLSKTQWAEVTRELGVDLPWSTRRANVLVAGVEGAGGEVGSLAFLKGKRIRIGAAVEMLIGSETKPCGLMDELQPGLRKALEPDCRGGVSGRVLVGGKIGCGDTISVLTGEGKEDGAVQ